MVKNIQKSSTFVNSMLTRKQQLLMKFQRSSIIEDVDVSESTDHLGEFFQEGEKQDDIMKEVE